MLGVATLIVVNSVMGGFSTKLRDRLHGVLSDVVIEAPDFSTFAGPDGMMAEIRTDPLLRDKVEAMAATHEVFAMLQNGAGGPARPCRVMGIKPEARARVGGFSEFLCKKSNRDDPSKAFQLDDQARRRFDEAERRAELQMLQEEPPADFEVPDLPPPPLPPPVADGKPKPAPDMDMPRRPYTPPSALVGFAIAHYRRPAGPNRPAEDVCKLERGDCIILTTVAGPKLAPVCGRFVVSDYVKTEMSEYDSSYVYVPLEYLQRLRGLDDHVTSIQIKLKDYADAPAVVERLRELFEPRGLMVSTWENKQYPLLAAISVEKGILNVLLFMIIAVAGFGILAIFSMIVVEKTRDIGILKALGASNGGVMKIFLGYGLLLGLVGAGLGTAGGLAFTNYINEIEKGLAHLTGQEIFDRSIYYFDKIPTDIQPLSVLLVNLGAVTIAVLFSVLPALRAAMLHPVKALRFE
jgi:lipoprotein-releasing system permease protein